MRLRMNRWIYFILCVIASCAPFALGFLGMTFPELGAELSESIISIITVLGFQGLAVLTYPAGILGTFVSFLAILFGYTTPLEALLVAAPFSITAGYLQWFVVIPRIFAGSPNSPLNRTRATTARAG